MMNWNQNDTKYILKRLILYFIIACIVFFAGQRCAKAMIVDSTAFLGSGNYTIPNGTSVLYMGGANNNKFRGKGIGYVTFTMTYFNDSNNANLPIKDLHIEQYDYVGLTGIYNCDMGNVSSYYDSDKWFYITNVVCPVNLSGDSGIGRLVITRLTNNGNLQVFFSTMMNFIGESGNGASDIINANNQATQNILNSQAGIDNAINTYGNQAHNDAQAIASAIQNESSIIQQQTTAINNQTDWFDQDYSSIIDTEFLDVFDDLFDNDDDVVRQFILIPLNFFVLIYNACSSNSCSPIVLGELYGTTLSIPCINWSSLLGTAVTNTIDIIFAGCLVFGMIRMIKKMINKIMTLSSTITDECGVEVFK